MLDLSAAGNLLGLSVLGVFAFGLGLLYVVAKVEVWLEK